MSSLLTLLFLFFFFHRSFPQTGFMSIAPFLLRLGVPNSYGFMLEELTLNIILIGVIPACRSIRLQLLHRVCPVNLIFKDHF